ncbi:MAG: DsrE family protein [Spirochaetota bacterium]
MAVNNDKLVVLWTSGDRDAAIKMVFMYTKNSKLKWWWKDIVLIVWGPSALLLSKDQELQEYVREMIDAGIVVEACVTCAEMYGVVDQLIRLGIEVKKMGAPLTEYMKEGRHVLAL